MLNEVREKLKEKQQSANKPFVHIKDAEEILEYQEKIFYMALEEILNQSNHSIPVHAFGDNQAACAMNDALNNIQQIAWALLNSCNDDSNRLDGVVIQKPAGGIRREEFVKTILDIRSMTSAKGDSKLWKKINNLWEDVQVIGLIENGEGYAAVS